ncbi:DNA-processing protein DprA [Pelagibaculum spongiae]|uniref:DNA-protecting protein DprA n=1 Tax=Pelagibaculum spongiae TaxID=2080658 RepID=A0A2V1GYW2_9GAMM|nr:DNA-processing protein DprA [Pelagibaculum spongiae]PVZ68175.1 DNA-protecting protein DprA [Pelagibaculum spongiae]
MIGEHGCSADEVRARLALIQCAGIGPLTYLALIKTFGDALTAVQADSAQLRAEQCSEKLVRLLLKTQLSSADPVLEKIQQSKLSLLLHDQDGYPRALGALTDLPPLLFARGNSELLNQPQLAVVGSRKASKATRDLTTQIAEEIALHGLVITSGLALGVDAAAHSGAVQARKPTIAVMGTGVDVIYPARHQALAEQILQNDGVLVSEFIPGTKPFPANFPKRNRIISGLSLGVLVAEAAEKSGSLITAAHALNQGREVMALPGPAWNPAYAGNNRLIQQGAMLVLNSRDVLETLEWQQMSAAENQPISNEDSQQQVLAEEEAKVLKCLTDQVSAIDQIIELCGLTAGVVSSILLTLELRGLIIATPGGFYRAPASYF